MNRPTRLYLAGPMSGLNDHGYPAFNASAAALREAGYEVVNPAELDGELDWDDSRFRWGACIVRDIAALNTCDGLALLDGWRSSAGAQVEHAFAIGKRMNVAYVSTWLTGWPADLQEVTW